MTERGTGRQVPPDWLRERVASEDVLASVGPEMAEGPFHRLLAWLLQDPDPRDMNICRIEAKADLQDWVDSIQSHDELWSYSSPPESWGSLCGDAGFARVANGVVIISTMVS